MEKVRWGVLGVARIAWEKVIPAMQQGQRTRVVAIASRDANKARAAAQVLGLPKAYGSYAELLGDAEIEAVYIPLPNHLHVPWSLAALEAGKHVLCEKPIACSAADAYQLVTAARRYPRLKLMEAFMYRFHPQWQAVRQLIQQGAIGPLRTIDVFFSYFNRDPDNIRNRTDVGGGALMDVGCYPVCLARWLYGGEPRRVTAVFDYDPDFRTDRMMHGCLEFPQGLATFTAATQLPYFHRVNVVGLTGRIELEAPFNPAPNQSARLWLHTPQGTRELTAAPCDQYTLQGDAFSQAIQEQTAVPVPIDDAWGTMRVIEALVRSGRTGSWERMKDEG